MAFFQFPTTEPSSIWHRTRVSPLVFLMRKAFPDVPNQNCLLYTADQKEREEGEIIKKSEDGKQRKRVSKIQSEGDFVSMKKHGEVNN